MYRTKKVSVVIPTYNEAGSIRAVIDGFFATGFVDEIIVVDNNAKDPTKAEVAKTNARLVEEKERQGYGHAIMRGLTEATGDLIVMVEADGTFDPNDIHKFLLYSDHFPVVFGTRTSRAAIWSGAFMPFPVRFGNWAVAKVLEVLHNGPTLTDVGCTYKLIDRASLERIKNYFPRSPGDGKFSPELMIWLIRTQADKNVLEIPIMYKPRVGTSTYTGSIWKAAKLGCTMLPLIFAYRFRKL
ncbi:MAG TPA: glycosyltransferase family 2 protein [Candidatus Paceibacterota bacterium]|nr:glycosyltransferase family 2 protein [Candidatus Paceibacterota bacterium]